MAEIEAGLRARREKQVQEAAAAAGAQEAEAAADPEDGSYRPDAVGRVIGGADRHTEVLVELLAHAEATTVLAQAAALATDGSDAASLEDFGHVRPPSEGAFPDGCPVLLCEIMRGRRAPKVPPVVGDFVRVVFAPATGAAEAIVGSVLPRRTSLLRRHPSTPTKPQLLCANLDLAVLVLSTEPDFSEGMVDRVLVSAHAQGLEAAIVVNKADLLPESSKERWEVERRLQPYERVGYTILYTSAVTGEGLPTLRRLLEGHVGILIGNSGVGKSHLLNALGQGQIAVRVGQISERLKLGKHTTTTSTLHRLPGEGPDALLVDSPGARRFSIWDVQAEELKDHFVEFLPLARRCRFGDCSHLREPGCAVMEAVEANVIPVERYRSYAKIHKDLLAGFEGEKIYNKQLTTAASAA